MSMPLPGSRGPSPFAPSSSSMSTSTSSTATITPSHPYHAGGYTYMNNGYSSSNPTLNYPSTSFPQPQPFAPPAPAPASGRVRSNTTLGGRPSPTLSPINTNLSGGMHGASKSLGSQMAYHAAANGNPNEYGSGSGYRYGGRSGESSADASGSGGSPLSPPVNGQMTSGPDGGQDGDHREVDDVAAAVRGLRFGGDGGGTMSGPTSPGPAQYPNINIHAPPGSQALASGRRERERRPSPSPGPGPEETTLRRIAEALAGSNDEGDTLDLSRQDIRNIGDGAVEVFNSGVGKGKKGVWRLALSYNSLRDASFGRSFAQLTRLRYLNLKGNYLTQFPTALTELASIEILDLSKNRITSFPDSPGTLTQLKVLSLTNNKIVTLPGYLVDFTVLKVFKVDLNPIEWPPKEVLGPLCDSDMPSRSKASESSSLTSGRSKRDEDLRPWIENMKSWMRQRATESQRLLNRGEEREPRSSEDEPTSATSLATSASASSFRSQLESPTVAPSSQETIKRAMPALNQDASAPYTPDRHATTADHSFASTYMTSPSYMPISPTRLRHARDTSISSFTSPPSASAPSSAHSRTPSGSLPQPPILPAAQGHTRGASYTATQRLSGSLTAKKSLPDLRQSHAQIIQDRRNDGQPIEESRPLGLGIAAPGVPKFQLSGRGWTGEMARSPTAGPTMSGQERNRIMGRKASADMVRRGSGDTGMGGEMLEKRNSQEGPQIDESRNSYFRRLSTLPVSTLSKAIPPALLKFIDAIRGILYALSQLHSALRQYLVFAVSEKIASVFSRVMEPASNYMNTLINALDRFDSMSRRNTPPVHAIRSVVDAAKESVAVFAKVVAVLRMQVPALKNNDVRYTRTLLTMIYSSMAEVVCSWQNMAPLLADIRPLLLIDAAALMRSLGGQKMVPTGSLSGRTPISPIIERRESQSPASVSRSTVGGSPVVPQVEESPVPAAKAGSMRTMGRSRRQAGSFSSQDVERGMLMGSPGGPRTAEMNDQPAYLRHRPSESATIVLDQQTEEYEEAEDEDEDEDEDEENERISFTAAQPSFQATTTSPTETPLTVPGTPPEIVPSHPQPIAMVPTTSQHSRRPQGQGHHPSSSSGSSHALSMTMSTGMGAVMGSGQGAGAGPHVPPTRKLSVDVRPPTPASASVFDEDLLDVIESATETAFECWLKLAEDVGASSPPPSSETSQTHYKSSSQSSTSSGHLESARLGLGLGHQPPFTPIDSSRRPPTISPKHHSDILQLLSVAEQITAALRESLMGLRANPMTYASTTLPDDAQAFIKTVVRVSELVKIVSATHQFPAHVRQACSRLTQHTRECAILIQVSSLRPSNSTPAPIPMSATASTTTLGMGMGSRPMSPFHLARNGPEGSQEDLGLAHAHAHPHERGHAHAVPHSAGWNTPTSGGWDSIVAHQQPHHLKDGLRGLQLPSRQMALGRSRSANAVPQPQPQSQAQAQTPGAEASRGGQSSYGANGAPGYGSAGNANGRETPQPRSAQPAQSSFQY